MPRYRAVVGNHIFAVKRRSTCDFQGDAERDLQAKQRESLKRGSDAHGKWQGRAVFASDYQTAWQRVFRNNNFLQFLAILFAKCILHVQNSRKEPV